MQAASNLEYDIVGIWIACVWIVCLVIDSLSPFKLNELSFLISTVGQSHFEF